MWVEKLLPHMTMSELQAELDALPATNGKKAPTWEARVQELMREHILSQTLAE